MAVTERQIELIKAGIPLMQNAGDAFLKVFYDTMLSEHPELYNYFNTAHQHSLAQPRALTHAVVAYAANIDKLQNIGAVAERIVNKHASLMIKPEHYPIVGEYLLRTIKEQFGPEVATQEFLDAWAAAYFQLADILIAAEEALYKKNEEAAGGWRGYREFIVADRVVESPNVTSFYLKPKDGKAVLPATPGQYLGFRFKLGDTYDCRQYSVSQFSSANSDGYRISVKRINDGKVSDYLHDKVQKGDVIEVAPPVGDFVLRNHDKSRPLVFLGAGIGVTPIISLTEQAVKKNGQNVHFIQCDHSEDVLPFGDYFNQLIKEHPGQFKYDTFFSSTGSRFGKADLEKVLAASGPADVYVIGPPPFMADIKKDIQTISGDHKVYYDFFGPQTFENDA